MFIHIYDEGGRALCDSSIREERSAKVPVPMSNADRVKFFKDELSTPRQECGPCLDVERLNNRDRRMGGPASWWPRFRR